MKLLKSVAPAIHWSCLISIVFCLGFLAQSLKQIKQEINNVYIIQIIQARQIETLLNLELRRTNTSIQDRLDKIREEYKKLEEQE
jgi:guanylate kinase